jgi:predicted nicotinamide N-methyase
MDLFQSRSHGQPDMPEPEDPTWLTPLLDAEAPLVPLPFIPELIAPRCHDLTRIWEATESALQRELEYAPFWATAWPGGIALARWILDHRTRFRSRSAVDVGCGSGIAGIAAARAGARAVLNEIDPLALSVARITARANHVSPGFVLKDLQATELEGFDIILVGDGFYERPRAARLVRILEQCVAHGRTVVAADGGRHIIDLPGTRVLELEVPVSPDVEARSTRLATVHLLEP